MVPYTEKLAHWHLGFAHTPKFIMLTKRIRILREEIGDLKGDRGRRNDFARNSEMYNFKKGMYRDKPRLVSIRGSKN